MNPVIVIPTYDEAAALPELLERILEVDPPFDVLVVDDGSPDGTGDIADDFAKRTPRVQVLHRPKKLGLGSAYRDGFLKALSEGATILLEMDADHSHNPRHLPALIASVQNGADLAIGSRYVHGVRVENWPFRRLMLSRFANYYVNGASGLPLEVVSDATSGFRAYRREVLLGIGLDTIASNGYFFQIEMAFRAWRLGFRIEEVPITFEEHYLSASKISKRIIWEAIWRTPLLRLVRPSSKPR